MFNSDFLIKLERTKGVCLLYPNVGNIQVDELII
jgi:hypothetical protein